MAFSLPTGRIREADVAFAVVSRNVRLSIQPGEDTAGMTLMIRVVRH